MENNRPDRLEALTSIRAIFSLMVIATHFLGYHPGISAAWMAPLGNTAVSWFFILSGFILAYNFPEIRGKIETLKFLVSRFWRLFPVQAITVLVSCLVFSGSAYLLSTQPLYLLRSLTLVHSWEASPFASQAFNVPAWSISLEWFFYLMFPLLIAKGWKSGLIITASMTFIAYLWATQRGCWIDQETFQAPGNSFSPTCYSIILYWPPSRLWEFSFGIFICFLHKKINNIKQKSIFQLTTVIILMIIFYYNQSITKIFSGGFFSYFFYSWILLDLVGASIILSLSINGVIKSFIKSYPCFSW